MDRKRCFLFWVFVLIVTFNFQLSTFNYVYALGPGTTGIPFLKIAPGARAVGMGEMFVALADDATALYWNPAGILQIKNSEVAYMHNFWFQSISYDYVAYVFGLKSGVPAGSGSDEKFGLSFTIVQSGEIQRTLEDASGNYTGTGNKFAAYDFSLAFTYAWKMAESYNFGTSLKFIRSSIDDVIGYAASVDFGFFFNPMEKLSFGINAQNAILPIPIRYYRGNTAVSAPHTLPMNIKVGAAYKLRENLTIGLDANIPIDNKPNFRLGAEYLYGNFALRFGYKTDFIQDIDALSGLCAGLGFEWQNYQIDYAFVPYGDLGSTHRVSLSVKF